MSLKTAFNTAAAGGTKEWSLSQNKDLKKEWGIVGVDNKGVCQGLCLCHAGMTKQGVKTKGGGVEGRKALYAFANQAQQYFQEVGHPDDMNDVGRMYTFLGRNFDLRLKTIREFANEFDYPQAMSEWAWSRAPGFFQILLPNHVTSFHLADEIEYFDPNVGLASFRTQNLLTNFMKSYHMSAPFKENYGTEFGQTNPRPLFVIGLE